jgi:hypothetical protein
MHGMMCPGFAPFDKALGSMDGTEQKCPRPQRAGEGLAYSGKKGEVTLLLNRRSRACASRKPLSV